MCGGPSPLFLLTGYGDNVTQISKAEQQRRYNLATELARIAVDDDVANGEITPQERPAQFDAWVRWYLARYDAQPRGPRE